MEPSTLSQQAPSETQKDSVVGFDETEPPPKIPGSKAKGRKRTKTGCLTCRKRRIKCGEEKPICQNCVKSKRQCEGYSQRVVFKDPLNTYRPPLSSIATTSIHASYAGHGSVTSRRESAPKSGSSHNPPTLAPKPLEHCSAAAAHDLGSLYCLAEPRPEACLVVPTTGKPSTLHQPLLEENRPDATRHSPPTPAQGSHLNSNFVFRAEHCESKKSPALPSPRSQPSCRDFAETCSEIHDTPLVPGRRTRHIYNLANSVPPTGGSTLSSVTNRSRQSDSSYSDEGLLRVGGSPKAATWSLGQPNLLRKPQSDGSDQEDDDPFDVSDDEMAMRDDEIPGLWQPDDLSDNHLQSNDLGIIVALHANQDGRGLNLRSYTSFIDRPDMLANYMPSSQSTPLRDPMTARIFCHFINVTGPSMSMFERNPANPAAIFQGKPVPRSQQHIWAYTFPTLALHNPALLHAMLALASLHIAKLQNGPITASYKHYALSLRRLAKSVSLPTRRGHPATLAAALLLAFYECWSADHQKWSNHLLGAKQLVKEINYAGVTQYLRKRARQEPRDSREACERDHMTDFEELNRYQTSVGEVDETLIEILMGRKIQYDCYGHIVDDTACEVDEDKEYTMRDLEIYETQRDLFWWYCKQDCYQAILGGGRLFMDYSLWYCPPRSPMGRLSEIYGTFDHMILLMGRLASFAARDLHRKRLAIKAKGGTWRPSESSKESHVGNRAPQTHPNVTHIPGFVGMVPNIKEASLPMGFESAREASPQCGQSDDFDLQVQTANAEAEWQEIRNAFTTFENHLGEEFEALGPEYSAPIQTPFGPALQYRTYSIAGIWMNYYMALITCYRQHPSMPPAAMMAAGITARQTALFACQIGRIAAGIMPDCSMTPQVNPGIGAALIESSTCLFVSGVQYQDTAQRAWTIDRLRDIARLTGWQTSLAIVNGLETSWIRTGELGKGPVYVRTKEERVVPDIWASSRRIDRAFYGKTNEERRMVIEKPDRVHYALGVLGIEEDFQSMDVTDQ